MNSIKNALANHNNNNNNNKFKQNRALKEIDFGK